MLSTRGFTLAQWQEDAVQAWANGDAEGTFRGTLEIVTGGGKTLIALACLERAARVAPDLKVAIVVPTEALARQWNSVLRTYTALPADQIGLLGAGKRDSLDEHRALITVLNTAAKALPDMSDGNQPLMLVIDECHRAGAATFSRVLATQARFRLALSATPEREEQGESGEPVPYDYQLVGKNLGSVVYRFTLRDAALSGWLPSYRINHHAINLDATEATQYESISRQVDDVADELKSRGHEPGRVQHLVARNDEIGAVARKYVAVTGRRKQFLFGVQERERVVTQIVKGALSRDESRRILVFHERVDRAESLFATLKDLYDPGLIVLEHSRLSTGTRERSLQAFRDGKANVLVSVKSLVEGIDVPEADVGISVASTSSVRQRIQSLGRVLRRQFDPVGTRKEAEMHVLYVKGTVDEAIYGKEDWGDLTGDVANTYYHWPLNGLTPSVLAGPPHSPKPTEEQEWRRLGQEIFDSPVPWMGILTGAEYSVDTLGTVRNAKGRVVGNPQGVGAWVERVRGRPGGRFFVTPVHYFVLVMGEGEDGGRQAYAAGRLGVPFEVEESASASIDLSRDDFLPGDTLPGALDADGGTFNLRQKSGGVITRIKPGGITEFALLSGTGDERREGNAKAVLDAWRNTKDRGITFYVSAAGVAWYQDAGVPRFLAKVEGMFIWPSDGMGG